MIFLGINSWKGTSRFNEGGLFFRWGGFIFKLGASAPWGGIGFDGGGFEKNRWMGGAPPMPDYGKPWRPRDYMVMWLYAYKPLKVSHHPAKFCGHGDWGSEDISFPVCQVISQDNVTKGLSYVMGKSPSRLVTIFSSLVAIGTLVVKICF